jgi:serine/threonine protein kinase
MDIICSTISTLTIGDQISSGGFATVYQGILNSNPVAIKVIKTRDVEYSVYQEMYALTLLKGAPNIVQLLGWQVTDEYYIVLEYWNGTLWSLATEQDIQTRISLLPTIIEQLTIGLECIHAAGLVHRDIKPTNILHRNFNNFCIADFGLTGKQDHPYRGTCCHYCPPLEIILKCDSQFSKTVDYWTLGATILDYAIGRMVLYNISLKKVLAEKYQRNIRDIKQEFRSGRLHGYLPVDDYLQDIKYYPSTTVISQLQGMLNIDPGDRILPIFEINWKPAPIERPKYTREERRKLRELTLIPQLIVNAEITQEVEQVSIYLLLQYFVKLVRENNLTTGLTEIEIIAAVTLAMYTRMGDIPNDSQLIVPSLQEELIRMRAIMAQAVNFQL